MQFARGRMDMIVVGGGPAALALALAARKSGGKVLRLGAESIPAGRHYALGLRARRFLKCIGAEIPKAAVVNRFWLFSGGRKAEVCAEESGLDSLCHVVSESALLDSLRFAGRDIPHVSAPPDSISNLQVGGDCATMRAGGELFGASLLAAADGARSRMAALAGVGVFARSFGQAALTGVLRAPLPADVAAQWFSRGSVLALLPICGEDEADGVDRVGGSGSGVGGRFSLIWSMPHLDARCLAESGAEEVARAVAGRTGMTEISAVEMEGGRFGLSAVRRAVRAWGRLVFIGDSARVIHPLAGQGLNLGLLDAEDLVGRASQFSDWGDASALASHAASRVWRAEALHRTTRFFAECGDGAATGILTAANCIRPVFRAAARFANGY